VELPLEEEVGEYSNGGMMEIGLGVGWKVDKVGESGFTGK
jgi:hypothetical protein